MLQGRLRVTREGGLQPPQVWLLLASKDKTSPLLIMQVQAYRMSRTAGCYPSHQHCTLAQAHTTSCLCMKPTAQQANGDSDAGRML